MLFRVTEESFTSDILFAMEDLHDMQCQDPHDRIAALASIFQGSVRVNCNLGIKENYSLLASMLLKGGDAREILRESYCAKAAARKQHANRAGLTALDLPS